MRACLLPALLLCVAAAPAAQAQDNARAAAQGRAIVDKLCSRCHQTGSTGESRLAQAPPFRELMERYAPEALEEALGEGLASGHPAMPEFKFSPEDVAAIVAYFETLPGAR